jgi:hypothetical protein
VRIEENAQTRPTHQCITERIVLRLLKRITQNVYNLSTDFVISI